MNYDRLSPTAARQMIKLLEAAGHHDLAFTLKRHVEGRERGETPEQLARLWME
jgi:hypothetical protein